RLYRQNRALVTLEQMPRAVTDAVLAAEDARFFAHAGYDLRAITRAALVNLSEDEIRQGGSTITQQYVKNTYFRGAERTLKRKARELRLAIEVERRMSKEEILEAYLNTVYLGSGAYGVKAAAEDYFGHGVRRITVPQAALLAAVIKAPFNYDPREHPKKAKARRDYVIRRMHALGMIATPTMSDALASPLGVRRDPPRLPTRQPYFVEAVKREIVTDPRFGANEDERTRQLWTGGLRVETTLDPEMQAAAERAVASVLNRPGDPEAALVAIRPQTGEVVAMVGGRDWTRSQVNLALGKEGGGSGRQPGSAFKPIAAAAAMESGTTLDTRFEAGPAVFTFDGADPWTVRNSDGRAGGFLTLSEAMVHSVNGVYARLALQIGAPQIVTQAKLMGVETKLPTLPSIALGSAEVSVLEMAAAYATLANYGTAVEPTTIKQIQLANGEVVKPDQQRVDGAMSPGNAFMLTKVLEQVIRRGTGRAANIGRPAAGKTGTTDDYADAWFVGYTPQLVTAVWVGYPQGRVSMTNVHGIRVYGGTFPALIWRSFMSAALAGEPVLRFRLPPSAYVTVEIDPVTGLKAAPWCPGKKKRMLRELVPLEFCPPPPLPEPTTVFVTPSPTTTPRPGSTQRGDDDKRASPAPSPTAKASPTPSPKEQPGDDSP
ncbi:MAG: PBP1A family penicillin-binding protein, partial [Actinomycetota bacterium]|nr:PBP1A family penicillin-binding protein [Actinomycetota bacterium]